jgi:hypothetical protein
MATTPDAIRPWIYLDTADLISIGDQKVNEESITQLVHSCKHSNAILIVSRWHLVDLRAAPHDAALRALDATERFPALAAIELHDGGAHIAPLRRVADLMNEDPIALSHVNDLATLVTHAEQMTERLDPAIPRKLSNSLKKLLHQMLQEETEDTAMSTGRTYLHRSRRTWPSKSHDHILATMLSTWRQVRDFRKVGLFSNIANTLSATGERETTPLVGAHIGRHLSALVDQRRQKQQDRPVGRGDAVDRRHVEFAPYVDIFTGDKDVCTWIEEWRSQIPYPREVTAINSNHIKVVIDAIKTLESKRS